MADMSHSGMLSVKLNEEPEGSEEHAPALPLEVRNTEDPLLRSRIALAESLEPGRKNKIAGEIHVWWLYDDGGMSMSTRFRVERWLLQRHKFELTARRLDPRVIVLCSKGICFDSNRNVYAGASSGWIILWLNRSYLFHETRIKPGKGARDRWSCFAVNGKKQVIFWRPRHAFYRRRSSSRRFIDAPRSLSSVFFLVVSIRVWSWIRARRSRYSFSPRCLPPHRSKWHIIW